MFFVTTTVAHTSKFLFLCAKQLNNYDQWLFNEQRTNQQTRNCQPQHQPSRGANADPPQVTMPENMSPAKTCSFLMNDSSNSKNSNNNKQEEQLNDNNTNNNNNINTQNNRIRTTNKTKQPTNNKQEQQTTHNKQHTTNNTNKQLHELCSGNEKTNNKQQARTTRTRELPANLCYSYYCCYCC